MLPQIAQIRNQKDQLAMDRERLSLTKETQEMQNALLKANTIMDFAAKSTQIAEPARQALAANYAELSKVLPAEALEKIMNGMPESSEITNSRDTAKRSKQLSVLDPRLEEQLAAIPDAQVRDIAMQSASKSLAGMDAGSARTSATIADRKAISDEQMTQGMKQQLKLVMTPQEVIDFEQNSQRILQGWEGLTNQRDIAAAQNHLGMLELSARVNGAYSSGGGGSEGAITPLKAVENINAVIGQLNDKAQNPTTRTTLGMVLRMNLLALAQAAEGAGDVEGAAMFRKLANEDLSKAGPAGIGGAVGAWMMGGKGKMATPSRNPLAAPPPPMPDTLGLPPDTLPPRF